MKNTKSLVALLALALTASSCSATQPNLIARGMNVTWDGTRHTVEGVVWNQARTGTSIAAAPAFLVYVDPEEQPVSSLDRPQVRSDVDSLAASATAIVTADFTAQASPSNANLGRVHSIILRADSKNTVAESSETDNTLETPLPSSIGATMIYGPSLVPLGWHNLDAGRNVGQTFTAPVTGSIVGLEITANRCSPTSAIPLRVVLTHAGTTLATASIPIGPFPPLCVEFPAPISGVMPGAGFFDLRSSPVPIVAGDSYEFVLHNDMPSGSIHVGSTTDVITGTATDFGAAVPSVDLTFKLFIIDQP
jgi:hypothetical protein